MVICKFIKCFWNKFHCCNVNWCITKIFQNHFPNFFWHVRFLLHHKFFFEKRKISWLIKRIFNVYYSVLEIVFCETNNIFLLDVNSQLLSLENWRIFFIDVVEECYFSRNWQGFFWSIQRNIHYSYKNNILATSILRLDHLCLFVCFSSQPFSLPEKIKSTKILKTYNNVLSRVIKEQWKKQNNSQWNMEWITWKQVQNIVQM